MSILDRIVTILVTATLVSAGWIVAWPSVFGEGGSILDVRSTGGEAQVAGAAAPPPIDGAMPAPEDVPDFAERRPPPLAPGELLLPVRGITPNELVDTFSQARDDGIRRHDAIDIMADRGTAVVSASAGTVEKLFESRKGGLTVYIRAPGGERIHYYAHLDAYADDLREGQRVRSGDPIGTVGSTGNARPDAPHLHYAIMEVSANDDWWEGTPINPYPLLTGE
jgi:murein DD-endopeptidase MepM/ murein hydrolase activator NlpD